jgi:hypothetical protein
MYTKPFQHLFSFYVYEFSIEDAQQGRKIGAQVVEKRQKN